MSIHFMLLFKNRIVASNVRYGTVSIRKLIKNVKLCCFARMHFLFLPAEGRLVLQFRAYSVLTVKPAVVVMTSTFIA